MPRTRFACRTTAWSTCSVAPLDVGRLRIITTNCGGLGLDPRKLPRLIAYLACAEPGVAHLQEASPHFAAAWLAGLPYRVCVRPLQRWVPPSRWGVFLAIRPTCGPLVILSPTVKRLGNGRRKALRSHHAPLWAMGVFVTCFEVFGLALWWRLFSHQAPLWATSEFVPRFEAFATP